MQDLAEADVCLSDYRSQLQGRVDQVTTQIIVRYREAPTLALLLLPPAEGLDPSRGNAVHDHHDAGIRPGQRAW